MVSFVTIPSLPFGILRGCTAIDYETYIDNELFEERGFVQMIKKGRFLFIFVLDDI